MYIPTPILKQIHQTLFRDGVMVAPSRKNRALQLESEDLPGVKNLYIAKALQSLSSQGYVKLGHNWSYVYATLLPAGVEFLRERLHLPTDVVPSTHVKTNQGQAIIGGRRPQGGNREDRGGYRRKGAEDKKEDGAPASFKPEFRGAGRGFNAN